MNLLVNRKLFDSIDLDKPFEILILPLCIDTMQADFINMSFHDLMMAPGVFNCGFNTRIGKAKKIINEDKIQLINVGFDSISWFNDSIPWLSKLINWFWDLRSNRDMNTRGLKFNALAFYVWDKNEKVMVLAIKDYESMVKLPENHEFSLINRTPFFEVQND